MLKAMQKVDLKTFALPYRGQNPSAVKLTRRDLVSVHRGAYAWFNIFVPAVCTRYDYVLETRSHLFMADFADIPC